MALTRYMLAGTILLRGSYSMAIFLGSVIFLSGGPNLIGIDSYFEHILQSLGPVVCFFWGLYASGYFVAGLLAAWGRGLALPVYGAAMMIDFVLWIASSLETYYDLSFQGRAPKLDIVFNLIDIALFVSLILALRLKLLTPLRWSVKAH